MLDKSCGSQSSFTICGAQDCSCFFVIVWVVDVTCWDIEMKPRCVDFSRLEASVLADLNMRLCLRFAAILVSGGPCGLYNE